MATCTISTATLTQPTAADRDTIFTTKAKISYSASATLPDTEYSTPVEGTATETDWGEYGGGENDLSYVYWEDYTQVKTRTKYTYSTLKYEWTFTVNGSTEGGSAVGSSGSKEYVTGLNKGELNTITGKVKVTCTETATPQSASRSWTEWWEWERDSVEDDWPTYPTDSGGGPGDYGSWVDGTPGTGQTGKCEATKTTSAVNVWTRPGAFTEYDGFSGGPTGTIIQSSSGLTVGKVANWCTHCNKFAHWYNQNSTDKAGSSCQATANGLITAGWYNACVDACADETTKPAKVTGGPTGTIITPSVFINLGKAISKEDS